MPKGIKGFQKGQVAWNKNKTDWMSIKGKLNIGLLTSLRLKGRPSPIRGIVRSEEFKNKVSIGCKKNGIGKWMIGRTGKQNPFYGKHHSIETRIVISKQQGGTGEFIYKSKRDVKKSLEYRFWRNDVFNRDNYRCVNCGSKKNLEADHIKSFAAYPELRFSIENGRVLCHNCHIKTDNYGHPKKLSNKKKRQI